MKKITRLAIDAFMSDTPFKQSNTEVVVTKLASGLLLHGRWIAVKLRSTGSVYITTTDYQTNLTKERLNGIPGVDIVQKNSQWFLNGNPWDGSMVKI